MEPDVKMLLPGKGWETSKLQRDSTLYQVIPEFFAVVSPINESNEKKSYYSLLQI